MQPIVNGLEADYGGRLAFDRVDANQESGKRFMRAYGLRGHPSYVLVDQQGNKLWSAAGVLAADALQTAIERNLD